MPKLIKQLRYDKKGNAKINCYHINLSKDVIDKAKFDDNKEVIIHIENGEIVLKQK